MLFGVASSSGEGIYGKAGFSVSNGLDFFGALLGEMVWLRTGLEGEAKGTLIGVRRSDRRE
jgi:hypothetical protein